MTSAGVAGWLKAVRREEDGWRGFVRFKVCPAAVHVLWLGEDELRWCG